MKPLLLAGWLAVVPGLANAADHLTFLLPGPLELPSFATWLLAKSKGYYSEAGLDVEMIAGKGGVDNATQVGAGNADIAEALGDAVIIVRSRNIPVRLIGTLGHGALTTFAIREDSGAKTLADLKGKKVAVVTFQDTTYYALIGALASVGLKKSDVDIQALGNSGMMQLLQSGGVQACACIPERVISAQHAGTKLILAPSGDYLPTLAQSMLASDKVIKERPEVIRRFVQATLRAWVQLRDNPVEEAKAYVAAVPAHKGEEAVLGEVFTAYSKQVWINQSVPGEIDPVAVSKVQDLLLTLDVIRNKTNVDDLYTNQFIAKK